MFSHCLAHILLILSKKEYFATFAKEKHFWEMLSNFQVRWPGSAEFINSVTR